MLSSTNLKDKSYEQIRDEAIAQIPIYSKDWTNYNISDPGITILENFAAFQELQQYEINEVPEHIKMKLLSLAGFFPQEGKMAEAFISVIEPFTDKMPYFPPDRMKIYAQNICFEQDTNTSINDISICKIITSTISEEKSNLLLDMYGIKAGLYLLGDNPKGGETIEFCFKNIPDCETKTAIYFELDEQFKRNPIDITKTNPFANIKWEIQTTEGYKEIAVIDYTSCFLQSGYVIFNFTKELCDKAVKNENSNFYSIRCILISANYDIVPRFQKISGLLMQVLQKNTYADVVNKNTDIQNSINLYNYLIRDGYLEVYGKESDGNYYRYYDKDGYYKKDIKRQYQLEYVDELKRRIIFDNKSVGDAIIICRDEQVMAYRSLGILQGYDGQIIKLPDKGCVYSGAFSVLVVENDGLNEKCHIVKPNNNDYGEVNYNVNEVNNTIVIKDCGYYEGAELRLGNFATYMGNDGNIVANSELQFGINDFKIKFRNCCDVTSGRYKESFEQLRNRFASDVRTPVTMVTQKDCEELVKKTPGLSIHKIGIYSNPDKNEIHVVVKPNSSQLFPKMSDIYYKEIYKYLDEYRMLTTKIVIEQPVYVPINVTGVIYVKKHFERSRERIEGMFRKILDGIHSHTQFGNKIIFHELYKALEDMDCVEEISDLSIFPDNYSCADIVGLDIQMKSNALYYPGQLKIEISTK